ncbi:MAG: 4-hydroxy-tetrahydrodipicolinate synthase [Vulcanimicrobiota bacterium]
MRPPFGRVVTAMVTAFKDNLDLDLERSKELAKRLIEQGNDSLVVCGTTGESPTLTKDEKKALFKGVREVLPASAKVIAGTGSNDTRSTIELSKAAADCGADALLLVSPYYNKPTQDMQRRHFLEIAEATTLPIMLYNIPGRTAVEIAPETLAKLAEHPRIVAVKQSLPDVDPVSDLAARIRHNPDSMYIYSGDDTHTLSILSAGGVGVVSVAGHVVGPQMREMIEHFEAGRINEARAIHLKIFPLLKGLFATTNPVLVKAALELAGFPVGGVRAPLYGASQAEIATLKPLLEQAGALVGAR